MSVRRIPKNYQGVTGAIASETNNSLVYFESLLERDLFLILDFDLNVLRYDEQPVSIEYKDMNNKKRTYTPDVLIVYRNDIVPAKDMLPMLCEVKPAEKIQKNMAEYEEKFNAAREYSKKKGWIFKILTEREIRTDHLENVKFLNRYRRMDVSGDDQDLIINAIYEMRETNPESLLLALSYNKWRRAELLPCLWHLISMRMIGSDLNMPLTMQSRIWTTEQITGGI